MNISELLETKIVKRDEHFLPAIVVDMALPAAFSYGAVKVTKEVYKEFKKNTESNIFSNDISEIELYFVPLLSIPQKDICLNSINDIVIY